MQLLWREGLGRPGHLSGIKYGGARRFVSSNITSVSTAVCLFFSTAVCERSTRYRLASGNTSGRSRQHCFNSLTSPGRILSPISFDFVHVALEVAGRQYFSPDAINCCFPNSSTARKCNKSTRRSTTVFYLFHVLIEVTALTFHSVRSGIRVATTRFVYMTDIFCICLIESTWCSDKKIENNLSISILFPRVLAV